MLLAGCAPKSGDMSGGSPGIFGEIGGFIFGTKQAPPPPPDDTGLEMFTFVGGLALAGVLIDAFLARRVRTHLLVLAVGIGLIPFVARTIEPAMGFVASIAALAGSAALIAWVLRSGWLKWRAKRDIGKLDRIIADTERQRDNGGDDTIKNLAVERLLMLKGRREVLAENAELRRSAAG